jgi:hypothetical protein
MARKRGPRILRNLRQTKDTCNGDSKANRLYTTRNTAP